MLPNRTKLVVVSWAITSVLCLSSASSAGCKPVKYKVGKTYVDSDVEVMQDISVNGAGLSPAKLVCLAKELKLSFHGKEKIVISIFSDPKAARNFSPHGVEESPENNKMAEKLRSQYIFDAKTGEDYIVIIPDGLMSRPDAAPNSTIGLRATELKCRREIDGRCLMQMSHLGYPWQNGKANIEGAVHLKAVITRAGKVTNVEVVQPANSSVLNQLALKNLQSWRFEPAATPASIQLVYKFELQDSDALRNYSDVQFDLPTQVIVRTGRKP